LSRAARLAAGAFALGLALGACGGGGGSHPATGPGATSVTSVTTAPAAAFTSYVATARVPRVDVFERPGAPAPALTLENPWLVDPSQPSTKVPQVFLVQDRGADGGVQVLLPIRPNGSTGWVRSSDVTLAPTSYRVRVELGAHRITVTDAGAVVYEGPVASGAAGTPTPTGSYYLRVRLRAPDPDTAYGPYAYGLSSHSDALETFSGGDAEIGIHGNDDASVLGTSITHGCIRMDNAAITDLARKLPLGTPVDVVA
jgi:lipoprotein-anchoring transpeptidase ErfK/SrfK